MAREINKIDINYPRSERHLGITINSEETPRDRKNRASQTE